VLAESQDVYADGQAVTIGPLDTRVKDLRFRVYYQPNVVQALAGLADRLATGRPGLAGSPAFYVFLNFVIRDLKVRYSHSALGFAWSMLNPLLLMLVFWVVFTFILGQGMPRFPVYPLAGRGPFVCGMLKITEAMREISHAVGKNPPTQPDFSSRPR
jgi:hypothetical protein